MNFSFVLLALFFTSACNLAVIAQTPCPAAESSPAFQQVRNAYISFRQANSLLVASMFFQGQLRERCLIAYRMRLFTSEGLMNQAKHQANTDAISSRARYIQDKLVQLKNKMIIEKLYSKRGVPSIPSLKSKLNKKNSIWFGIGRRLKEVLQSDNFTSDDERGMTDLDDVEEVEPVLLSYAERIGRLYNQNFDDISAALLEMDDKKLC